MKTLHVVYRSLLTARTGQTYIGRANTLSEVVQIIKQHKSQNSDAHLYEYFHETLKGAQIGK